MTSSTNLDLVRSIYAAWERADYSSSEWADPEVEFVIADGPSPGRWTGVAGMADAWGDFLSAWTDFRIEVEEYRELDHERVLVLDRFIARGRTSGLELGESGPQRLNLFYLRDGKVTKIVRYLERASGLADLGLAPEAGLTDP